MCYNSFVFFVAGMDLLKHGESAYPADAWVEQQYMQDFSMEVRDDWEMLNFWKSFVNGFTYNQVGKQNNYYLQCKFDLFGGRKKQQQKIVSMLLLFLIYLCLVLSLTLARHRIVFYVTAMGVNLSPLLIIFFNQHVSHPTLSPLHNSAYEHYV